MDDIQLKERKVKVNGHLETCCLKGCLKVLIWLICICLAKMAESFVPQHPRVIENLATFFYKFLFFHNYE